MTFDLSRNTVVALHSSICPLEACWFFNERPRCPVDRMFESGLHRVFYQSISGRLRRMFSEGLNPS